MSCIRDLTTIRRPGGGGVMGRGGGGHGVVEGWAWRGGVNYNWVKEIYTYYTIGLGNHLEYLAS